MERSRSKRYYYEQDYEHEGLHSRSKPRYSKNSHGGSTGGTQHYGPSFNQRRSYSGGGGVSAGGGVGGRKVQDLMVTTSYRILCLDMLVGGVIGKSGSIINSIRQHTGAWVNVQELVPGDDVRIIEISDTRRRDPDGRMPAFSPAQEALFMIHDRILETEMSTGSGGGYGHGFGDDENGEFGGRGNGGYGNKVVSKLVVSKMHVGCLLGKGGKIIEQMRIETKTHIRVLPRDHNLPRCIAMADEIVQVVGDLHAVKDAMSIISSRLRESQHRDRNHFPNRQQSPERPFPDNNFRRRPSADGPTRYPGGSRNNYPSRASGFAIDAGHPSEVDNSQPLSGESLVFRILSPATKLDSVLGELDGILDLLQNEIGVIVDVTDQISGLDEHVIIISSDEGPDDELFPAQEALLHIQTRIVDLIPEKENIITTRLLLQSDEVECLGLKDGSLEHFKIDGVNIQILPREVLPAGVSGDDEILQIVGELKAARQALMEVTFRVRNYVYGGFVEKDAQAPDASSAPPSAINGSLKLEASINESPRTGNGPTAAQQRTKDVGPPVKHGSEKHEDQPTTMNRISKPLVTRSTLEIVIPPRAASMLASKARKLILISELSGASIKLIDDSSDTTEKIIQISGTPDQTDKAQSLLQEYILSAEEDGP